MSLELESILAEFNFKMDKPSNNMVYEFEGFHLDAGHLMLYRENDEVALAPKAVETLLVLVERRGAILSKEELMSSIWTDSIVEESNLAQYLYVLRKTLGNTTDGKPFIETLRRRGYRFNGEVLVSEATDGGHSRDVPEEAGIPHNTAEEVGREVRHQNLRSLRVQKRGNVLALADWKEAENDQPPDPEIMGPAPIQAEAPFMRGRRRWYTPAAILAAMLVGALSIFWYRPATTAESPQFRNELTISNLTAGEAVDHAATISPDGNYFVYASHDGEKVHLWLHQTGQASRLEIIPPFAGAIHGTTFSPDSQFVYFVANENDGGPNVLYRVPALGGAKTKVTTDVATSVSFSPDGGEMAFMRGDRQTNRSLLLIAGSDGTGERVLVTGNADDDFYGGGAWSPDGSQIAYGVVDTRTAWHGGCTIVGTNVQSGDTTPLSPEKWDTCFRMAWTRDAKGLVFVGTKSRESYSTRRDQIYYLSLADGQSRRLTTDGNRHQIVSLGVTNNDEVLAVPFNRLSQIWAMDANGDSRTAMQITKGFADGRGGIAPLPDGRIAYLTRHGDGFSIWQMNADGSDRIQLTTEPPQLQELRSAPNGDFFMISAWRDGWNHLYRLNADGTDLRQMTFGESAESDSTISTDGNWIVYDSTFYEDDRRKTGLRKVASDGRETTAFSDTECQTPHYSPDAKLVSCVSADWKNIYVLSSENGAVVKAFATAKNPILNAGARWTPDGNALAYIVLESNVGNIRLQPIDGGATRPLTDFTSGDIYNFAYSADSTRLYLARGYSTKNAVLISNFR